MGNALGIVPLFMLSYVAGETTYLQEHGLDTSSKAVVALALSCLVGVGIAWAVWNCRNQVAATTFTLIGVVCKLISVFLNVIIGDKHATPMGIFMLLITLGCSSMYKQAPMREQPTVAPKEEVKQDSQTDAIGKVEAGKDEEQDELLLETRTPK